MNLDAPILRQPAFSDVEVGHDLEARYDSRYHIGSQRRYLIKNAIHAKAYACLVTCRFDMDVACTVANGSLNECVHHVDDRAALCHLIDCGIVIGSQILDDFEIVIDITDEFY